MSNRQKGVGCHRSSLLFAARVPKKNSLFNTCLKLRFKKKLGGGGGLHKVLLLKAGVPTKKLLNNQEGM